MRFLKRKEYEAMMTERRPRSGTELGLYDSDLIGDYKVDLLTCPHCLKPLLVNTHIKSSLAYVYEAWGSSGVGVID